jgi:hypothetical protein
MTITSFSQEFRLTVFVVCKKIRSYLVSLVDLTWDRLRGLGLNFLATGCL